MPIRLIKHEAAPKCGSFEIRLPDGKPSKYFYWEDVPSRRLGEQITSEQTLERAKGVRKEGEAGAKLMDISVQTVGVRELDDFETAFKAMNDKLVADYS
jgi:hypothetical protein